MMNFKLATGYVLGALAFSYAVYAGQTIGASNTESVLNVLLCVAGGVFGWIAGILITPRADEKKDFLKIGGALMTFITGFALAKIEPILDAGLANGTVDLNAVIGGLLFAVCFGVGALFVFVGRKYWQEDSA